MLSYQHAYHAGNHADLLKHFVLTFVIGSLNKKDKPYTFFDTHSGSGLYDLLDNKSIKTGEAAKGIEVLLKQKDFPPELLSYVNLVKGFYKNHIYPGSPAIEKTLLRKNDVLILTELHPAEIENLRTNMNSSFNAGFENDSVLEKLALENPEIQIHKRSGWEMLKALTPPKTKRGAVLIDPSYEEISDYENAAKVICDVLKKWSNGIFMLWYPLLSHREIQINQMLNQITDGAKAVNQNMEILRQELLINTKDSHIETELKDLSKSNPPRLYGSGMLVLNSPWKLKEFSDVAVEYFSKLLYEVKK